jgi:hypothetical protein
VSDKIYCTMLHLFDDLWLDKIIPKNNDEIDQHMPSNEEEGRPIKSFDFTVRVIDDVLSLNNLSFSDFTDIISNSIKLR